MHQRGSNDERSSRPDSDLWTKQGRREEANFSSLFMWNSLSRVIGDGCHYGHRPGQRRKEPPGLVLKDGTWSEQDASILVPGKIVSIKLGDIIPVDTRLLEGDPSEIDQSALTAESLPVTKNPGDEVYSGSACKQGEIT
ncbi:unnamed protein product [Musa hybrid cultivar]